MPADQLQIDNATVLDNIDASTVEFTGEVDGEEYEFAVEYGLLEALSGDRPDGDAMEQFERFSDTIKDAALVALGRNSDAQPIAVGEGDLEE